MTDAYRTPSQENIIQIQFTFLNGAVSTYTIYERNYKFVLDAFRSLRVDKPHNMFLTDAFDRESFIWINQVQELRIIND